VDKEILNLNELANELQMLNPNAKIALNISGSCVRILSSIPADQMNMPQGFYYNEKNGITNKHNTKSGAYINVHLTVGERSGLFEKDVTSVLDSVKKAGVQALSDGALKVEEIIMRFVPLIGSAAVTFAVGKMLDGQMDLKMGGIGCAMGVFSSILALFHGRTCRNELDKRATAEAENFLAETFKLSPEQITDVMGKCELRALAKMGKQAKSENTREL
jgi:hypothetical protein